MGLVRECVPDEYHIDSSECDDDEDCHLFGEAYCALQEDLTTTGKPFVETTSEDNDKNDDMMMNNDKETNPDSGPNTIYSDTSDTETGEDTDSGDSSSGSSNCSGGQNVNCNNGVCTVSCSSNNNNNNNNNNNGKRLKRSTSSCKCSKGYKFSSGKCTEEEIDNVENEDKDTAVEQEQTTDDSCFRDGDCGVNAQCEVKTQVSFETSLQAAINDLSMYLHKLTSQSILLTLFIFLQIVVVVLM